MKFYNKMKLQDSNIIGIKLIRSLWIMYIPLKEIIII